MLPEEGCNRDVLGEERGFGHRRFGKASKDSIVKRKVFILGVEEGGGRVTRGRSIKGKWEVLIWERGRLRVPEEG